MANATNPIKIILLITIGVYVSAAELTFSNDTIGEWWYSGGVCPHYKTTDITVTNNTASAINIDSMSVDLTGIDSRIGLAELEFVVYDPTDNSVAIINNPHPWGAVSTSTLGQGTWFAVNPNSSVRINTLIFDLFSNGKPMLYDKSIFATLIVLFDITLYYLNTSKKITVIADVCDGISQIKMTKGFAGKAVSRQAKWHDTYNLTGRTIGRANINGFVISGGVKKINKNKQK